MTALPTQLQPDLWETGDAVPTIKPKENVLKWTDTELNLYVLEFERHDA